MSVVLLLFYITFNEKCSSVDASASQFAATSNCIFPISLVVSTIWILSRLTSISEKGIKHTSDSGRKVNNIVSPVVTFCIATPGYLEGTSNGFRANEIIQSAFRFNILNFVGLSNRQKL